MWSIVPVATARRKKRNVHFAITFPQLCAPLPLKPGQKHGLKPLCFLPSKGKTPSFNHTLCKSISCVLDKDQKSSDLPTAMQKDDQSLCLPVPCPSNDPQRCLQTFHCNSPASSAWRPPPCCTKTGHPGCVHGWVVLAGHLSAACSPAQLQ